MQSVAPGGGGPRRLGGGACGGRRRCECRCFWPRDADRTQAARQLGAPARDGGPHQRGAGAAAVPASKVRRRMPSCNDLKPHQRPCLRSCAERWRFSVRVEHVTTLSLVSGRLQPGQAAPRPVPSFGRCMTAAGRPPGYSGAECLASCGALLPGVGRALHYALCISYQLLPRSNVEAPVRWNTQQSSLQVRRRRRRGGGAVPRPAVLRCGGRLGAARAWHHQLRRRDGRPRRARRLGVQGVYLSLLKSLLDIGSIYCHTFPASEEMESGRHCFPTALPTARLADDP